MTATEASEAFALMILIAAAVSTVALATSLVVHVWRGRRRPMARRRK